MLELMTNVLIAGPLGMYTLYEAWSPLFEIADHWREGRYAYAILLAIFAIVLAVAVVVMVSVVLRKLRNRCWWWRPRSGRDGYEMVSVSDRV